MVKECKIARVHFLGFRQDVPQILNETDVVTLVSKREGLPRCLMEAMAFGKPVVASDIRGSRDLVVNNKNGILVPLDNISKLVEALEKLIVNVSDREEMGRNGSQLIEKFSLKRILVDMSKIYERFL